MKFLIRFRPYATPAVPYDKEADKMRRGFDAWLENKRLIGSYAIAGTREGIGIWEGDSIEQLHMDIMSNPSHRLGDWEILALIDNREVGHWDHKAAVWSVAEKGKAGARPLNSIGIEMSGVVCSLE